MDDALIAVGGVVVGALLGGTGKYFTQRRDVWTQTRASGLLLLADVRALRDAQLTDRIVAETAIGVKTWKAHREVLVRFRRGNYPSGFIASEWLTLARCFAHLDELQADLSSGRDAEWWQAVQRELKAAEQLLARFEPDGPVLRYVVRTSIAGRSGPLTERRRR